MKKVLLCSPSPNNNGGVAMWTKYILNHFSEIHKSDVDIILFPMERKGYMNPHTKMIVRVLRGMAEYFMFIIKYVRVIRKIHPEVIHISSSASLGLFKDYIMQKIARWYHIRHIIHYHFGLIPELAAKNNWEWKLLKVIVKKADVVVVLDNKSLSTLNESGFTNIRLIPNPISQEVLNFIDFQAGEPKAERKIVYAGHIVRAKGVYELIRACLNIPDIHLVMLGKSPVEIAEDLSNMAKQKDNGEWLSLRGEQSQELVLIEMKGSAVFVLPSYTEGFPNVILESMACGCSIVATSVGAIPEMLNIGSEESAGLCVQPKNADTLQEAITKMLEDSDFSETCRRNARRRVENEYSINIIWKQLCEIWK